MSEASSTPADHVVGNAIATIAQRGLAIDLSTTDLCFLAALHLRSKSAQLSSLAIEQLEDVFADVSEAVDKGKGKGKEQSVTRSPSHAIARLRKQSMLSRIDGLGVVRAPEYVLTRLASAIVEYCLEDEVLTRESLQVLTQSLMLTLRAVKQATQEAGNDEEWMAGVTTPLRVTIGELVRGIERRQRGLDQQQESFQNTIRGLLDSDWFGAIGKCEALLETTSGTLRELSELLLQGTQSLLETLQEVMEHAREASQPEAETAAHLLIEQIDRIVGWGSARQSAWSEYFQYVHRFLRDVVRLDPSRALTQRLREQLSSTAGRSFALALASDEAIILLREVEPAKDKPPVSRPKESRDRPPKETKGADPAAVLEAEVREHLAAGATALSEVTEKMVGALDRPARYLGAGRIAQSVATISEPSQKRPRPWVLVGGDVLIEDWELDPNDTAKTADSGKG